MEVNLGPFQSAAEACDYCFGSFTKEGDPPAAAGYAGTKNGCTCNARDMEHMAATTCTP